MFKFSLTIAFALTCGAHAHTVLRERSQDVESHSTHTRAKVTKSHSAREGDEHINDLVYGEECSKFILDGSMWQHGNLPAILCGGYEYEMITYLEFEEGDELGFNPCQEALELVGVDPAIDTIDSFNFEQCLADVDTFLDDALVDSMISAEQSAPTGEDDVASTFYALSCIFSIVDIAQIGSEIHQEDFPVSLCSGFHSEMMYYLSKTEVDEEGLYPCQDALENAGYDAAIDFITTFDFEVCIAEVDMTVDFHLGEAFGLEATMEPRAACVVKNGCVW
ncbi:unnamed protein product [Cylindrotheca closterium]|uniref:Uncharacterized protein n=1 Tax=Cylindrotheca closterium TaxID=2856 RepID=A0AAD2FMX8_9STRA|nr:unnamed protein product [Cylindrotheca closterium]